MDLLPSPRESKSLIYPLDMGQGLRGWGSGPFSCFLLSALAGGHILALLDCPAASLYMVWMFGEGLQEEARERGWRGPIFFHTKIWAHASFHPHAN